MLPRIFLPADQPVRNVRQHDLPSLEKGWGCAHWVAVGVGGKGWGGGFYNCDRTATRITWRVDGGEDSSSRCPLTVLQGHFLKSFLRSFFQRPAPCELCSELCNL